MTENGKVKGLNETTNGLRSSTTDELTGKYLTFRLNREEYGIPILNVREIIGLMNITCVPGTPGYIRGVINLRGRVIPVLDLGLRFEMGPIGETEETCIIVVEVNGQDGVLQMGVLVDAVLEVLDIGMDIIGKTPGLGRNVSVELISGIAEVKSGVKILLDIEKVVTPEELEIPSSESGKYRGAGR